MARLRLASGIAGAPHPGSFAEAPQVELLQDTLNKLNSFNDGFTDFSKGKKSKVPESLTVRWKEIVGLKDRIGNLIKDFRHCDTVQMALQGPSPGEAGQPGAQDAMKSSVSQRINTLNESSHDLIDEVDKAQRLLGANGQEGLGDRARLLMEKLSSAQDRLHSMTSVDAAESSLAIPPQVVVMLSASAPYLPRRRGDARSVGGHFL